MVAGVGDGAELRWMRPMSATTSQVKRPSLRYFGGKWLCAPWIIERLPDHRTYVEAFCGGASVLLRKPRSYAEVINDSSGAVVNFFRVLRDHGEELHRLLTLTPYAADEFAACREPADDPVERARRFFVRSWFGFGGASAVKSFRGFRRCAQRDIAGQAAGAVDALPVVTERLRRVTVENLDWRQVVAKYRRKDTLLYVDPPYLFRVRGETRPSKAYGEHDMGCGADHLELLEVLNDFPGPVALSGYEDPMYELRLAGWGRHERKVSGPQNGGRVEVLWVKGGNCA